jgi:hypothetical protein
MKERIRRTGLRLLALLAALVVWWVASVEKREQTSERVVDASVSFNSSPGMILLDPIQTVKVRLRGPDRRVRGISPFEIDLVVDVEGNWPGTRVILLSPENVVVPADVEVRSIEPNSLAIRVDREATALLPVLPRLVGEPAAGALPGDARVVPDKVTVRGPEGIISGLTSVSTNAVSLDGHALSFAQTVSVVSPDPLVRVVEPPFVTVQVPMVAAAAAAPAGERREKEP